MRECRGIHSDTSGHWAESAIDRWSACGIVSGDGNGFNPDGNLTRGQMATFPYRNLA